jgi:hypothetical protein
MYGKRASDKDVAAKSNCKQKNFFVFCTILQITYRLAAENKMSAAATILTCLHSFILGDEFTGDYTVSQASS